MIWQLPLLYRGNSDQFILTQFPFPSFQEMAFSLAYCSAFEIRYSGVVFADMSQDTASAALTFYHSILNTNSDHYCGVPELTFSRQSAPPFRFARGEAGEGCQQPYLDRLLFECISGSRFSKLAYANHTVRLKNFHDL